MSITHTVIQKHIDDQGITVILQKVVGKGSLGAQVSSVQPWLRRSKQFGYNHPLCKLHPFLWCNIMLARLWLLTYLSISYSPLSLPLFLPQITTRLNQSIPSLLPTMTEKLQQLQARQQRLHELKPKIDEVCALIRIMSAYSYDLEDSV